MTKSRNILPPRQRWTPAQEATLRDQYPHQPTSIIAKALGMTVDRVYNKAHLLGLKKSPEFLASDYAGRIQRGRTDPRMTATQFKPGLVPWNKGTHYTTGGRSAETRFKPGRKPQEARNYLPIGSLRISKDGYLERKVTDDPALVPARRWVAVHRLVWQQAHGPVPDGHCVAFKTGMFTNREDEITLDRVECISRAENARRNHWKNHPTLAALVPLKGAITRQVNRITREAEEAQTA